MLLALFATGASAKIPHGTPCHSDLADPCKRTCGSKIYDLDGFRPKRGMSYFQAMDKDGHQYFFDACARQTEISCQGSSVHQAVATQTWSGSPPVFPSDTCANLGALATQSCSVVNGDLTCEYANGDANRSATFRYICGASSAPTASHLSSLRYLIEFTGPAACSPTTPPVPAPFPMAASYTAHLRTTNKSKLCASCTFDGRHHYDSDPKRLYGHVAWLYGPTACMFNCHYVNFLDIFLGVAQQMFLVQDHGGGKDGCMLIDPYPAPIFNGSWAASARYLGTGWFHGRLTRRWAAVYPYFIQGEVYPSVYHEDVFTRLPAGFVNEVEEFWYDAADFVVEAPEPSLFLAVQGLNCSAPPAPAAADPLDGRSAHASIRFRRE